MKLKDTLMSLDIDKVALVGLPCQAQYLYQVKNYPILETDFSEKIKFIISLFCLGTFATEAFLSYVSRSKGIPPEKIFEAKLKEGNLIITHTEGKITLSAEEVLPFMQLGCLLCPDYTGVFADLSAGISENNPGHTVLITRNSEAEELVVKACEANYLELKKPTQ